MSKKDIIVPKKVDDDEKRVERSRGRSHKANPTDVLFFCLLLAAVAISI